MDGTLTYWSSKVLRRRPHQRWNRGRQRGSWHLQIRRLRVSQLRLRSHVKRVRDCRRAPYLAPGHAPSRHSSHNEHRRRSLRFFCSRELKLEARVGFEPWGLLWNLQVTDSTNAGNAQNARTAHLICDPITIDLAQRLPSTERDWKAASVCRHWAGA